MKLEHNVEDIIEIKRAESLDILVKEYVDDLEEGWFKTQDEELEVGYMLSKGIFEHLLDEVVDDL